MVTIDHVVNRNPGWFSEENKQFFNDIEYWIDNGGSGKPYLVRSTYGWTDMFNDKKRKHYRVNHLESDLKMGPLVNRIFWTQEDLDLWIEEN